MKKSQPAITPRKHRRTPRKTNRPVVALPAGLPLGTQQALMGLAAFEARQN
ncbi:MAG: hypothetical protein JNL09_09005 [Anaerolineales bacterium]|nr:hypothetical protein [Anaerolineales bacterium]